jgi:hypothetical protein
MPVNLRKKYLKANGTHKGVYAIEGEVKEWLKGQLSVN